MLGKKNTIGRAEAVAFPELNIHDVHARIDTGAKTSSIWVSNVVEKNGSITVTFLDGQKPEYRDVVFNHFSKKAVASSNGHVQERYVIKLLAVLDGRKIRARFNLADRATQVYPVLIGRNILHGKFLVDVTRGDTLKDKERARSSDIQQSVN